MLFLDPENLSRILEMGGLGVFIWFCIRGLQAQIASLKATVELQKDTLQTQTRTLSAMEARVMEAERLGALYRGLIEQLPQDLDNYKAITHRLKDQVIQELEATVTRRDQQLREFAGQREQNGSTHEGAILVELPKLRAELIETFQALEGRLSVLDLLQPGTSLRMLVENLDSTLQESAGAVASQAERSVGKTPRVLTFRERASDG